MPKVHTNTNVSDKISIYSVFNEMKLKLNWPAYDFHYFQISKHNKHLMQDLGKILRLFFKDS